MKISILTLFPQMFQGPFDHSIVKNAREKELIEIALVDIRDFGIGKHKSVDDTPYGGGHGMILKIDVLKEAIMHTRDKNLTSTDEQVFLLSASGETYTQQKAKEFSKLKHLILICGHYEGVDGRIKDYIDGEISIGDYVLTGGEIPSMVIVDSVARLISGVLKEGVVENESFSDSGVLEHPQFTRPQSYEGKTVPDVLLSGDHKKIDLWKKENSGSKS